MQTRLSLLDLNPRSNQPFWDQQGRYGLIYNGEIYNFKELRTALERKGVHFRTTSDTEVLLAWLITCGVEATLPKLEAMFAFALYDKVDKTFILARDRFGMKPLFIYDADDMFLFASEIGAMRPWIPFEPDLLSISSYLYGFAGPTKGHSFFKNIAFLAPGTVVKIRLGTPAQYRKFFSIPDFWDPDEAATLQRLKPQQLIDQVEERLLKSVKKQLFADAPVGALCSGGVDSSLVMAMASRFHNNLAIFHANVTGPLSEYQAAAQLAKHLKLDLKTVDAHDQDFIDRFPEAMEHYGHPFSIMPSSIPFLMVCEWVRHNGVKAVLTGEGSDECYLGYKFLAPDIRKWRTFTKATLKSVVQTIIRPRQSRRAEGANWSKFLMGFSPYCGASRRFPAPPSRFSLPELIMGLHNRFEVALETEDIRTCVQSANGARTDPDYTEVPLAE